MMQNRRVGTLTLGVALVLIGILIPIGLFTDFDVWFLLRLSPILLVALGGEIIYYVIRKKEEKIRYDGLSIFMIVCITLVTIIGASVQPIIERGIEYSKVSEQNRRDSNEKIKLAVRDVEGKVYASAYTNSMQDGHSYSYDDGWYVFFGGDEPIVGTGINIDLVVSGAEFTREQAVEKMTELFKATQGAGIENLNSANLVVSSDIKEFRIYVTYDKFINSSTYEWINDEITEHEIFNNSNNYDDYSDDSTSASTREISSDSLDSSSNADENQNSGSDVEPEASSSTSDN